MCQETRQASVALEREQPLSTDQTPTRQSRAQTGRTPQEPAREISSCYRAGWHHDSAGEDFFQRLAEAVWQEHRTSRTRDVCRASETPSCKDWRHPERNLCLQDQTESVLSWVRSLCQKAPLSALAYLPVWDRAGAARFILGLPAGLS